MSGRIFGGWPFLALILGSVFACPAGSAEYLGTDSCLECHEEHGDQLKRNPHGSFDGATSLLAEQGCEACHGPGSEHVFDEGSPGTIASLAPGSDKATAINGVCLQCHQAGVNRHWQGSAHDAADVVCSSCHRIHQRDGVGQRDGEADVCYRCHTDIRAKAYRPYGHPLKEHKVVCSQCHNPHGGAGPHSLDAFTVNDNCYMCHAEKRGPFLFEHFPVAEDCTLCHDVHGSIHRGALSRSQPFLCIECHQEQAAGNHVREVYDFARSDELVARGILGRSCLNCHSQVHGTNHPSGVSLMR